MQNIPYKWWKTTRKVRSPKITVQKEFSAPVFQKKRNYEFPRATVDFTIFLKENNMLHVNGFLNVRHSQTTVFVITNNSNTFDFALSFQDEVVDNRINLFNDIHR